MAVILGKNHTVFRCSKTVYYIAKYVPKKYQPWLFKRILTQVNGYYEIKKFI